ncbi:MAG: hypothetical protein EAZ09_07585 [Oscillatoriales cyanobacterium]|nr:MAG: hypothetical protein EAZ18_07125 [Oscillatoriales cyanobacterium]TAH23358.1 MAG: hypothetical protein EAZ09_07585 [Oscillatoriales cyanobacterium]
MVIGYWLLVIGYWLLVIGYWLLVMEITTNNCQLRRPERSVALSVVEGSKGQLSTVNCQNISLVHFPG